MVLVGLNFLHEIVQLGEKNQNFVSGGLFGISFDLKMNI